MSGPTKKSEFRNTRKHHIGVVLKREDGKMKGSALEPEGRVWMDEEEQMATANAPRSESDNPFVNGDLELVQSARALANRRPIGDTEHPQQETGGQIADEAPPAAEPEPVGAGDGDDEEEPPSSGSDDEAEADEDGEKPPEVEEGHLGGQDAPGSRQPTKEEQEASARAAAARRRAPAANEKTTPPPPPPGGHTGSAPPPEGKPPEGKRAPAEEVGSPEAVPQD